MSQAESIFLHVWTVYQLFLFSANGELTAKYRLVCVELVLIKISNFALSAITDQILFKYMDL